MRISSGGSWGGGNFGIVDALEIRPHPSARATWAGMLLDPLDQARDVLAFYRDYSLHTPDEMICGAGLLTSPDGIPMVTLIPAWFGDHAEGERYLKPMREFGRPAADLVGPVPYVAHQKFLDAAVPHGIPRYLKMGYVPEMAAEFIDLRRAALQPDAVALVVHPLQHDEGGPDPGVSRRDRLPAPRSAVVLRCHSAVDRSR